MANINIGSWIPFEYEPGVLQRVKQGSAVINFGQEVQMTAEAKSTPRSGGAHSSLTGPGGDYQFDTTANDNVWLYAQKYTGLIGINQEDIDDTISDVVNTKLNDFTTSTMITFDNHCLGVTGAKSGITLADGSHPAFDSLYYQLTQNDSNTGYVANTNITQGPTGGLTYDSLRAPIKAVETGNYFRPGNMAVIAHPAFLDTLRGIKDGQGRPIFNESSAGVAGGGQGSTLSLFGHPLQLSLGCRLSAAPTDNPTGHPFLVFCTRDYLLYGTREVLSREQMNGLNGPGYKNDTYLMKTRMRRAFVPGHENAFAMLVDTSQ